MADWITSEEAVRLSGYSANYLRILIRSGKIRGDKWARSWRISKSSLNSYLKSTSQLGKRRGRKPREAQLDT